jgi:hypothetical protein
MAKRYGYRPGSPTERDGIYPSEIATQRPALATKVDCSDYMSGSAMSSVRGDHGADCYCNDCHPPAAAPSVFNPQEEHEPTESACERFNRQLRGQPLRGERE